MDTATAQLQAILFTSGGPVAKKRLMTLIGCTADRLKQSVRELEEAHRGGGVTVIDDGTAVSLATDPSLREYMEGVLRDDRTKPLSRASQETLAIIAYAGPITKIDLDFLRGVNTQYTVRRLLMRGLIQERKERSRRSYTVTAEFLTHIGVRRTGDLPDYESVRDTIHTGIRTVREQTEE